jgi:hypothetical protein
MGKDKLISRAVDEDSVTIGVDVTTCERTAQD